MAFKSIKKKQQWLILSVLLIVVLIIMGMGFLLKLFQKDYYKVESRVENVKNLDVSEINDFATVGWLRIQGTSLDYPVLNSKTNNYEFPVNFNRYVWSTDIDGNPHNMITIFGHNIMNLSANPELSADYFVRFEELMSFVYYDFAKVNKYFQFTVNGEDYLFKIFAVNFVSGSDSVYFPFGADYTQVQMKEHIDYLKMNSLFDYDVDVDETDDIVSLVTCTRFFGIEEPYDFYVTGRLLRKNEKVNNYKVVKSNHYTLIEDVMKKDREEDEKYENYYDEEI